MFHLSPVCGMTMVAVIVNVHSSQPWGAMCFSRSSIALPSFSAVCSWLSWKEPTSCAVAIVFAQHS